MLDVVRWTFVWSILTLKGMFTILVINFYPNFNIRVSIFTMFQYGNSKFECQSTSYWRDTERTIISDVNKPQVMFLFTF